MDEQNTQGTEANDEADAPASKDELLERIRNSHDTFEATLARLNAEQMLAPALEGGWSPKDIMSHITAWERLTVQRLQARNDKEALDKIMKIFEGEDEDQAVNAVNMGFYLESRDLPLPEVRKAFNSSYEDIVREVEGLSEESLLQRNDSFLRDGAPLWEVIAGNTFDHYPEHQQAIQRWIDQPGPAGTERGQD